MDWYAAILTATLFQAVFRLAVGEPLPRKCPECGKVAAYHHYCHGKCHNGRKRCAYFCHKCFYAWSE